MNPEELDKLIKQRVRAAVLQYAIIAAILLALGAAGGYWFASRYQVVPRTAQMPSPAPVEEVAAPVAEAPAPAAPITTPAVARAVQGPFAFRFTPGERLVYHLSSKMGGTGTERSMAAEDIALAMDADMTLDTKSVDYQGDGALQLAFGETRMKGNFMGNPVDLYTSDQRTRLQTGGRDTLDTMLGQATAGIPQLEWFRKPIDMRIAPDGEVLDVRGPSGLEQILGPVSGVYSLNFPAPEMGVNTEWESEFKLPIPGVDNAPVAKTKNRFTGYQVLDGHNCAVIEQDFTSAGDSGSVTQPKSALGDEMHFGMPQFSLTGRNTIYFDVDAGHVYRSDINLRLGMKLAPEFQPFMQLFRAMGDLLDEMEGGQKAKPKQQGTQPSSLDLGIDIQGQLNLMQTTTTQAAKAAQNQGKDSTQ